MAAVTTFLVGAVVGGGVKWAYDKWHEKEDKPDMSVTAVRERSAATVRNVGQSVSKVVRRGSKDVAEAVEPEETADSSDGSNAEAE